MIKTLLSACVALLAINTVAPPTALGQVDQGIVRRKASAEDSVALKRYWKGANSCSLYSRQRQRCLDSALMLQPQCAYYWQQKAMPLYKQRKYEAGAPYLDSAVKYGRREYIDYRGFMKCIFQKSYRVAINDFHEAKSLLGAGGVMDHTYDFYLGLCHLQLNQIDSAEHYFVKTIRDQQRARGEDWVHNLDLFYLGIVYYEKEQYEKAIQAFDKSLKQYSNFSDAKFYKSICLKNMGKKEEAALLFDEAKKDYVSGATINEDSKFYEQYPYQVPNYFYK